MLLSSLLIIMAYVLGIFNLKAPIEKKVPNKRSKSGIKKTVRIPLFDRVLLFFELEWAWLWFIGIRHKDGSTAIKTPIYLKPFMSGHTRVNDSWKPVWKPRAFVWVLIAIILLVIAIKFTPLAAIPIFFLPMTSEEVAEQRKSMFLTTSPREWNGDNESQQAISDKIDGLIPVDFGTKYYISTTGNDANAGTSPALAWATFAHAFATVADGDTILVEAGTYAEGNLDITNDYITLIMEHGVIISGAGAFTTLTVSGDFVTVRGGWVSVAAFPQIAVSITGDRCNISNVLAYNAATHFRFAGSQTIANNITSNSAVTTGFEFIGGASQSEFYNLVAYGTTATRHFYLNGGNSLSFIDCKAVEGPAVTSWEIAAGSDSNVLVDCGGQNEVVDGGANNEIIRYSIGSQIVAGQSRDQDLKDIYDAAGGGGVTGDVFYVATTGNDANPGTKALPFLTIDYGVGQLTPNNNDLLYILPGTYDENVNVDGVQVDVAGATIRAATIEGNQQAVIVVNSNGAATSVFNVSVNNVVIEGISSTEATNTVEGIVCTGDNCIFNGIQLVGAMENGISTSGARNIIYNCTIYNQTNDGIELAGASKTKIVDCIIGNQGDNCIHDNGGEANYIKNTIINGESTTGNGIYLNNADYTQIESDVTITNCVDGIELSAGTADCSLGAKITNCTNEYNDLSGVTTNIVRASLTDLSYTADNTYNQVNAILTLGEGGGTLRADGTEQIVYIENTPAGVFKPRYATVDFENMVAGDAVTMRIYERLNTGGSMDLIYERQFIGANGGLPEGGKHWKEKLSDNRFGIQVTLQQDVGTYRDFDHDITGEA